MADFFLNDIGIICLAFWIALGFLIFWYICKASSPNEDNEEPHEFHSEALELKNPLFEHVQETEELDHGNNNDQNNLDHSTNSENQ